MQAQPQAAVVVCHLMRLIVVYARDTSYAEQ